MNLKKHYTKYTLQDWIFVVFSVLWIFIVVLDYLNKQVVYLPSRIHFKYFNLIGFLTLMGLFFSMSYCEIGPFKKWKAIPINGILIFIMFMTIVCLVTLSYNKYWKAPLDLGNYFHLIGKGIYTLGCSLFLVVAAYSSGNLIRNRVSVDIQNKTTSLLVDIALGFVVYHFVLMILGSLVLLNQLVILGLLTLMIGINYIESFRFLKLVL